MAARTFVLGEFPSGDALCDAALKVREKGMTDLDIYSPYPLHGGSEALGLPRSKVPLIAFTGGMIGVGTAALLQWGLNAYVYPINVGGRPLASLPTYVPIMFELGVLLAAFSIVFGLFGLSKLPMPYHPVFESEAFRSASTHGFWMSVGVDAAGPAEIESELKSLGATTVEVVHEEAEE